MTYLKQKPGSIEEVIAKQQEQYQDPNYKAKFDEALKDSIRGIGSMTPKEKTEFFNKIEEEMIAERSGKGVTLDKTGKAAILYQVTANVPKQMSTDGKTVMVRPGIKKYDVEGRNKQDAIKRFARYFKMKSTSGIKAEPDPRSEIDKYYYVPRSRIKMWSYGGEDKKGNTLYIKSEYEPIQESKEEWKPSNGKHADESLMKDFLAKGGKVEKVPENKRAYNGNRIKPHLANEKNLARQEAMSEETITEKDGANTSSRQGSASRSAKKKYRFGYRVAEKQPKGNDIEEAFSSQLIKQAYGILNDPRYKGGNYSGAVEAIEKLAKGLSKHPDVANALKRANESVEHDSAFAISGVETERPTEDIQEGKWSVEGITGYKNISGQDRFTMIISASSKADAEKKWEKELDKHRAKRNIGPGGGGGIEDPDDIDINPAKSSDRVGDIEYSMTHSYDPSYGVKKETIDAGEVSKMKDKKKEVDFKTANVSTTETIDAGEVSKEKDPKKEVKFSTANVSTTEDKKEVKKDVIGSDKPEPNLENTIRNIWNKAANETTERGDSQLLPTRNESKIPPIEKDNKPGVKIAKIRATRDAKDGKEPGAKDPTAMEKQILTLQGQVNVLKAKLENEKGKVIKPVADKETGQVPLTVGIASKLLRDKAEKEADKEKTKSEAVSPYKLKYETLRARLKEKAEKEKLAKKKDEPTKGRTMTGNPASKVEVEPKIDYTN